jgi:NAD(P)-dependent dehydrogenase (short-subunit alcohol dehydrogenase family)
LRSVDEGSQRKVRQGHCGTIAANISSKENLQNLDDEGNKAFGKIDVLVCNAASNPYYGPLAGISDDQFNKILSNNIVDMQLARNLACEYGEHNVRVNCIAPGLVKTDFAKALWDDPETLKASTSRSPLLRIGIPDEIAGAAVLMGSAAGNFMTGQTVVIDGGATIS